MSRATAVVQRRLESLAREHTEAAIDAVVDVMNDPLSEAKDRLAAAREIFDRGYGKAAEAPPSAAGKDAQMLAALSDDELIEAVNGAQLPRIMNQPDANKERAARAAYAEGRDPLLE